MKKYLVLSFLAFICLLNISCGPSVSVKGVICNELGKVMVVEYHRIEPNEGEWIRSAANFRKDLERFHNAGFVLVSIKDFFNEQRVNVPAGKKPLMMTFDDGHPTQFRWLIVNGATAEGRDGFPKIDPDCAVGILDDFCNKHPDFGRSATFFLNSTPFYQSGLQDLWKKKLQYLVKTGREIGNHTFNHDNLSQLSFGQIKQAIALQQAKIEEALPSYEANSIALPFGILPDPGKWLLQDGEYNGKSYHYKVAFLVGAAPTLPPYHVDFDPALVQRVQASDAELDKWLGKMEKDKEEYFVSDGDQNTITVPESSRYEIDLTQVRPGMTVRLVSGESVVKQIKVELKKNRSGRIKTADRGVYYTFHSAGIPSRIDSVIENYKKTGLNTLVIDMKDVEGTIGVSLEVPLAQKIGALDRIFVKDLKGLIDKLHSNGIRVSARISVFKDRYLAGRRSDLALKVQSGGLYINNEGVSWVDPFSEEVRDYNIKIAEEAAKAGADEIQFDYIRFPEKNHPENIAVPKNKEKFNGVEKFLREAYIRLQPYDVSIAIDVFGVMAWLKDRDIEIIGQRVGEMAKYVDAVCPMLYPSHFDSGFAGHPDPANDPYRFVKDGIEKAAALIKGSDAKQVPWIQGFDYRVRNFNEDYILKQKKAVEDCGLSSFLVWNAGNRYSVTYKALSGK